MYGYRFVSFDLLYLCPPPRCIHFTRVFALLIATNSAIAMVMLLVDAVFRVLVVGTGADQKLLPDDGPSSYPPSPHLRCIINFAKTLNESRALDLYASLPHIAVREVIPSHQDNAETPIGCANLL